VPAGNFEGTEEGPHNPARAEREERWLRENQEAIAAYNRRVAEHGLLSDDAGLPRSQSLVQ
jgi:post-segregation antitoxin (ccd killing protein)